MTGMESDMKKKMLLTFLLGVIVASTALSLWPAAQVEMSKHLRSMLGQSSGPAAEPSSLEQRAGAAAEAFLAGRFIVTYPADVRSAKATVYAKVADQSCRVELTRDLAGNTDPWLVDGLDCEKPN
jgi:hypothetical protein